MHKFTTMNTTKIVPKIKFTTMNTTMSTTKIKFTTITMASITSTIITLVMARAWILGIAGCTRTFLHQ